MFEPSLNQRLFYSVFGCKEEDKHKWDLYNRRREKEIIDKMVKEAETLAEKSNSFLKHIGHWVPVLYQESPTAMCESNGKYYLALVLKEDEQLGYTNIVNLNEVILL